MQESWPLSTWCQSVMFPKVIYAWAMHGGARAVQSVDDGRSAAVDGWSVLAVLTLFYANAQRILFTLGELMHVIWSRGADFSQKAWAASGEKISYPLLIARRHGLKIAPPTRTLSSVPFSASALHIHPFLLALGTVITFQFGKLCQACPDGVHLMLKAGTSRLYSELLNTAEIRFPCVL